MRILIGSIKTLTLDAILNIMTYARGWLSLKCSERSWMFNWACHLSLQRNQNPKFIIEHHLRNSRLASWETVRIPEELQIPILKYSIKCSRQRMRRHRARSAKKISTTINPRSRTSRLLSCLLSNTRYQVLHSRMLPYSSSSWSKIRLIRQISRSRINRIKENSSRNNKRICFKWARTRREIWISVNFRIWETLFNNSNREGPQTRRIWMVEQIEGLNLSSKIHWVVWIITTAAWEVKWLRLGLMVASRSGVWEVLLA